MIINKSEFDPGTRGFYGVSVTIHYKGPNGEAMKSYADGYLFLHVAKRATFHYLRTERMKNLRGHGRQRKTKI